MVFLLDGQAPAGGENLGDGLGGGGGFAAVGVARVGHRCPVGQVLFQDKIRLGLAPVHPGHQKKLAGGGLQHPGTLPEKGHCRVPAGQGEGDGVPAIVGTGQDVVVLGDGLVGIF